MIALAIVSIGLLWMVQATSLIAQFKGDGLTPASEAGAGFAWFIGVVGTFIVVAGGVKALFT